MDIDIGENVPTVRMHSLPQSTALNDLRQRSFQSFDYLLVIITTQDNFVIGSFGFKTPSLKDEDLITTLNRA